MVLHNDDITLSGNGRTLHIDHYYDALPGMLRRYDRASRQAAFPGGDARDWRIWQTGLRERLRTLLGFDLMESAGQCPLNPRVTQRVRVHDDADDDSPGIVRERILIQVEPDVWMPCYALIPNRPRTGADGRPLCWLCPHGHQGGGKYSVAGVHGIPAIDNAIRKFNYDYGLQLARRGYVALCPDARGFGERRDVRLQKDDERPFLRGTCAQLAHMAEPLGLTVAGLLVWDLMRLVDYVQERGEWSMGTLGCFGFSGGGMQTLWLAALDDRIRRAFISGYMYGVRDSLLTMNGNCSCNYVPGLWNLVDMGDVGSLIAPRPLVVQSCVDDHLNGPRGVVNADEQVAIIRSAYRLLGSEEHLTHLHASGEHHFDESGVWDAVSASDRCL
ncbi:alpha/beta hydrolase family protein [Bifidobacterium vansinderenii]|uniref:Pectinesterase A n=1 Tax=Bifidobacterium vansinderenii TaxID=1984871 RepID=A0A229VW50_9BIFI|nr:alpha/beta hydrolase family protein [Bifidobacterium vansinderenii]OXM99843.1 Pectinesterase A precursor [Bifidobacterium vansinderenii]